MNKLPVTLSLPVLPLYATPTTRLLQVGAIVIGTAILAASSWIQVPMVPVPMTMQTLAVTLLGAFYGWRLAGLTVLAWLVEAAVGMPVLAGGHAGLAYMAGPTGGYLAAFALVAVLVGWLAERGVSATPVRSLAVMLIANALILAIGAAWLTRFIGLDAAIAKGVVPFVLGGAVKAALATGLVEALGKKRGRQPRR